MLKPRWIGILPFFVLRKNRRCGVGTAAAHAVFARHPGILEFAVARKNVSALAFWRRTISGFPKTARGRLCREKLSLRGYCRT